MPLDEDVVAAIYRDHGGVLRGYLFRTARNIMIDNYRQQTVAAIAMPPG